MAKAFGQQATAHAHEPEFDRYLLERSDRPLAVLLSDGRDFILHAVTQESGALEGRRFHSVAAAERALDRLLEASPAAGNGAEEA